MKFTAAIIEDELLARENLKSYLLRYFPQITVKIELDNKVEAIDFLKNNKVDIVFLDIQLKDGLGIEVFDKIRPNPFNVIFITAHEEYALEAFRIRAFGYLLKPLDPYDFKEIVNRILDSLMRPQLAKRTIKIPIPHGHAWIDIENIVRCESQSNYTKIYGNNGKQFTISKTLKFVEEKLIDSERFVRIHQSHLINIDYIKKKEVKWNTIELKNGLKLPVARKKKEILENRFLIC